MSDTRAAGAKPAASPVCTVGFAVVSDAGRHRATNEDSCLALPSRDGGPPVHLFAVADGLGGHNAGDVASRLVVESLARSLDAGVDRAERWVRNAFTAANLAVYDHAMEHHDVHGMQSTATALLLEGNRAVIGHVGDCRAYLLRGGDVDLCTTDHSRAMEMLRMRIITPEEAVDHPMRNQLTRSLGAEVLLQVDVTRRDVAAGDTFVLCCDGLWSEVSRAEIAEIAGGSPPDAAARALVDAALERDAPDNVSVIVVRVDVLAAGNAEARGRRLRWWR